MSISSGLAAAADGDAAEADVAAATALAQAAQAVAARLEHVAAGLVAAGATDTDAILGAFALAETAAQIASAALNAIAGAAAAAGSGGQRIAEVLQGGAAHGVIALAMNLQSAGALFESQLATRHDTPAASGRRSGRRRLAAQGWRLKAQPGAIHQHGTRHSKNSFSWPWLLPATAQAVVGVQTRVWRRHTYRPNLKSERSPRKCYSCWRLPAVFSCERVRVR